MKPIIRFPILCAVVLLTLPVSSCGPADDAPIVGPANLQGGTARLKMKNKFYTEVQVLLEGPETREVTVPARSSHTIELKSGVYRYTAGARDFLPISRYKALEPDRSYTIYF